MTLLGTPDYDPTKLYEFDIESPGGGGINLQDLIYELDKNQSPNMLNMMYRNGHLCKRFGQENYINLEHEIVDVSSFGNEVYLLTQEGIYVGKFGDNKDIKLDLNWLVENNLMFFCFDRKIYAFSGYDGFFYKTLDRDSSGDVYWQINKPYIPDIVINRTPDGSYSDPIENYNRMGPGFKNTFNGDGTSTVYYLTDKELDRNYGALVQVDNVDVYNFTFDAKNGTVTFDTAPGKGQNNVVITAFKTVMEEAFNAKYCKSFGGTNNSRLFMGGCGDGKVYYSDVLDPTYFPSMNWIRVGNDENDVTGFGEQYDTLMIFKPNEIHSLEYYIDGNNSGAFNLKLVNSQIGCDAPKTIQLINNQLTWLSSRFGVCTLVSTNIEDERNIRIISRNINKSLLQENNLKNAVSVDWDNKYMLAVNGKIYMWDYLMSAYYNTGKIDNDSKRLSWFIFDNFDVEHFIVLEDGLYYTKNNRIIRIIKDIHDFGEPINAYYQTPYLQFDAVDYLKTVKNVYVQVPKSTDSLINMTYFTENSFREDDPPEEISDPIIVTNHKLWDNFKWNTFAWNLSGVANTFRRKCSLKKIQMCSVVFDNNEINKDIPISHLTFQYSVVKNIK